MVNEMTVTCHAVGEKHFKIGVKDLGEASHVSRTFIMSRGIGASQLGRFHGQVRQGRKVIAFVSYNGRVWEPSTATQLASPVWAT